MIDFKRALDGVEHLFGILCVLYTLCLLFVPLGIWKFIEIILWVWHNVSVHVVVK